MKPKLHLTLLTLILFVGTQVPLIAGNFNSNSEAVSHFSEASQQQEFQKHESAWHRTDISQQDGRVFKWVVAFSLVLGIVGGTLAFGYFILNWGAMVVIFCTFISFAGLTTGMLANRMKKKGEGKLFKFLNLAGITLSGIGLFPILSLLAILSLIVISL